MRGYSIFSREVEEKILEHPQVLECALVGAPHPEKKEVPVAFVQLNAERASPRRSSWNGARSTSPLTRRRG